MCRRCEPELHDLAEGALSLDRWREENDPKPVGEAIDSVLSLLPVRVERRRWAVRALVVMRARGLRPHVEHGALRVPMEELPAPLCDWLTDPGNRALIEDLLDEEARERHRDAA
jgi:hypothetical protein